MRITLLLILFIISGCSAKKKDINQTMNGHEELYSMPSAIEPAAEDVKRVVIAATNDLHGHYGPVQLSFKDKHNPKEQTIKVGGVDYLAAYMKVLRETYQGVLLVDSGDIFPSEARKLNSVASFYETLGYDAITYGLNDFNLRAPKKGPAQLIRDFARDVKTPVLLSNLYELKTARGVEWKGVKPYIMKEVNGIKIGILGVVPDDIVTLTPVDNRVGLYVESMVQNTLHNARLLRSLGAELIVVITHHGIDCGVQVANTKKLPLKKVNFEPEKEDACELQGTLGEYIRRLPAQLVNVIIGGRHHEKMANFVNGIVVLSGFPEGQSLSLAEFSFDRNTGNLLPEKTVVQQPVMICHEFFKETKDCYTEDKSVDHKERIPATFLGQEITPVESMRKKFSKYFTSSKVSSNPVRPEAEKILKYFDSDLIFTSKESGSSQLIRFEVSGKELSRIFEEKFNSGLTGDWIPSPFKLQGKILHLEINRKPIEPLKSYRIVSDLESMQNDFMIRKFIVHTSTRSHPTQSWDQLDLNSDDVNVQMSASQRQ